MAKLILNGGIKMKKLFVAYDDGSKTTYTMKNSVDHMQYVDRHIKHSCVSSIILQQYPKKNNKPIVFK